LAICFSTKVKNGDKVLERREQLIFFLSVNRKNSFFGTAAPSPKVSKTLFFST
jgi:hypothetical protein